MLKRFVRLSLILGMVLTLSFAFWGCGGGDDAAIVAGDGGGDGGGDGDAGDGDGTITPVDAGIPADAERISVARLSAEELGALDVSSAVAGIVIGSPPVVTFTVSTAAGVYITGLEAMFEEYNRFVRFTLSKLVTGTNGDNWVSYTRNDSGTPSYDSGRNGATLVGNGDGSYVFTFSTDVTAVEGVTYDPTLTHRLAGQLGGGGFTIEPQNLVYDFVPGGGDVTNTRKIATMTSCNECHDNLVFHGRRFEVEYCVNCHNPDLASGEGNFSLMVHRIHESGDFAILDDAISYAEVTYPQDLANCQKCHDGDDAATPEGDNWKNQPNAAACTGCHYAGGSESTTLHSGSYPDMACTACHTAAKISTYHLTPNATPNNPDLPTGVPEMAYEIKSVTVDAGTGIPTVVFSVLVDGVAQDINNMPTGFYGADGVTLLRDPGFLMAWAQPQAGIAEPADYNNLGRSGAQPVSIGLDDLTITCDDAGECTTELTTAFPAGSTLRAVGLQGYFRFDTNGDGDSDENLHTPSAVKAVTGDNVRRTVVDNEKCFSCHEWFEGHGGNRVYNMAICTVCHVPNLSSSGRTFLPDGLDSSLDDTLPLLYPEDTNNLKDMVHGIHSSGVRTNDFTFVRGGSHGGYYNWSEVTFPRGASVKTCNLCHTSGSIALPSSDALPSTVRTTGVAGGQDADAAAVTAARASLPNATDLVNSPVASTCYYCHDSAAAEAHFELNGGSIKETRNSVVSGAEACAVCHDSGKTFGIDVVHADD